MSEQANIIAEIDRLATEKYSSPDAAVRRAASDRLERLNSVSQLMNLRQIMEQSNNTFSQFLVAKILLRLVNTRWNLVDIEPATKLSLRAWLLSVIMNRGPTFGAEVLRALIEVLARVTKLGWLESQAHQNLPAEVRVTFLEGDSELLQAIGLMLLREVVADITTYTSRRTFTQHRRTSVHFKESALLEIFSLTLKILASVVSGQITSPRIFELAMTLCHACLVFDFVGGVVNDSGEEPGLIHVPQTWRPVLMRSPDAPDAPAPTTGTPPVLRLLWDIYKATATQRDRQLQNVSTLAVQCLVQLTAMRRSVFVSEDERQRWLNGIMAGVTEVLENSTGLNGDNFHEICRLLSRLRPTYQLSEIVAVESYSRWIEATLKFTCAAFQHWQTTSQSHPLLLSLWARLISALPFLRTTVTNIAEHSARVTQEYIQVRMKMAQHFALAARTNADETAVDPLDNIEQLSLQLEHVPPLVRGCYAVLGPYLTEQLQTRIVQYQALLASPNAMQLVSEEQGTTLESSTAWLLYVAGVIISHPAHLPTTYSAASDTDGDADLTASAFVLADTLVQRAAFPLTAPFGKLECALLTYFQVFRRVYVGQVSMQASRLYHDLSNLLSIRTQTETTVDSNFILSRFVEKLTFNLRTWGGATRSGVAQHIADRVVRETLILLQDLTGAFAVSSLSSLPPIRQLLLNHTEVDFPFLLPPDPLLPTRQRSGLLRVLTNLLFADSTRAEAFEKFLEPQRAVLEDLTKALEPVDSRNPNMAAIESLRATFGPHGPLRGRIAGLLRDLRGVAWAADRRARYMLLFKILFRYLPTFEKLMVVVAPDSVVSNLLMKFIGDFAVNRMHRIVFDVSSPSGILLFKHTAEIARIYLMYHCAVLPTPDDFNFGPDYVPLGASAVTDLYRPHIRGITSALTALQWALTGQYCCFGVFSLYNDPILNDVLSVTLECMLKAGVEAVFAYPKLSAAFFLLLETLCESHIGFFLQLPPAQLVIYLRLLETAISSVTLPKQTVYSAANAIGHLATYVVQNREQPEGQRLLRVLHESNYTDLWARLMTSLFNSLLFDESNLQWNVSRTLLPLIMLEVEAFKQYKESVLAMVPTAKRPKLEEAFAKLFDGFDGHPTLETEFREKFGSNLTSFKVMAKLVL